MTTANLKNEEFFLRLVSAGKLRITKSGHAFNLTTGKEIAKDPGKGNAYRKLSWQSPKTKKIRQIQLHRLVWAVFKGAPADPNAKLNHKDGCKRNCQLSNLEITDDSGNITHALATGLLLPLKGEEKPNSVFTDSDVIRLRREFAVQDLTYKDLADKENVHHLTMFRMLRGSTYGTVKSRYTKVCRKLLPKVGRGFKCA